MNPRPCVDKVWLYDALIDHAASRSKPAHRGDLVAEARATCSGCPIQVECWTANVAAGEGWAELLVGKTRRVHRTPPAGHPSANVYAARLPKLERLAARNAKVSEAAAALGVTGHSLYKWCLRWGHLDLWQQLRQPTQAAA